MRPTILTTAFALSIIFSFGCVHSPYSAGVGESTHRRYQHSSNSSSGITSGQRNLVLNNLRIINVATAYGKVYFVGENSSGERFNFWSERTEAADTLTLQKFG